ncbi:hypothetical protein BTS2_1015 [Bacillus sp. TS-2]|nr:hypothetical protein BTS2_1015 [Bacillus sp. TS-2]
MKLFSILLLIAGVIGVFFFIMMKEPPLLPSILSIVAVLSGIGFLQSHPAPEEEKQ